MTALPSTPEMFDLRMSEAARPLFDRVVAFIADRGGRAEYYAHQGATSEAGAFTGP